MSDERWDIEKPENGLAGTGPAADDSIIDGTAEVIHETVDTESAAGKEYESTSGGAGGYENYSAGASSGTGV